MENNRVLVIEDDPAVQNLITLHLIQSGYSVLSAYDGEDGRRLFLLEDPCLILLDLNLPKVDGKTLCKEIRVKWKSDVPIIIVSAMNTKEDKIDGLRMGADDYVTKPFEPEELVERVRTVIRRAGQHCLKMTYFGLTLKPRKKEVWLNGRLISMTKTEYRLLYCLMKNPNQVNTREQLLEQLYPLNEKEVYDRTIDVHVKKLREKIEKHPADPERIITVRGVGYKFVGKGDECC